MSLVMLLFVTTVAERDYRYCSSAKHLLLLLSLLTSSPDTAGPHSLAAPPGLVILWDIARLLMRHKVVEKENIPKALDETDEPAVDITPELEFVPG